MKITRIAVLLMLGAAAACNNSTSTDMITLTQEWDKTFPKSDKVEHSKITFHNRYGITLAADLYKPLNTEGKLPAIAVSGPYGAVKEQVDTVTDDMPLFVRRYHDYYKTERGYHHRSPNSNGGKLITAKLAFANMPLLSYIDEIRSAVMLVHGEQAHSRYFSEDAYKRLQGDNKQLLIVPGADHTDLYDNMSVIPFDEISAFYIKYLK